MKSEESGENEGKKRVFPQKTTGSPEPIPGRCGAKLKYTDPPRYCKKWPLKNGNGRCSRCGGRTPPKGPTHPNFKTGKYSKLLPPDLARRVNEAANDPTLLSGRAAIELIEARYGLLIERLSTGESGKWIELLRLHWSNLQAAQQKLGQLREDMKAIDPNSPGAELRTLRIQERQVECQQEAADALKSLGKAIEGGATEEGIWRELINLTHELQALKDSEMKNIAIMRQTMTAEQAMLLVMQIQQAIADVITDQKTRIELGRRLQAITGGNKTAAITASNTVGTAGGGD